MKKPNIGKFVRFYEKPSSRFFNYGLVIAIEKQPKNSAVTVNLIQTLQRSGLMRSPTFVDTWSFAHDMNSINIVTTFCGMVDIKNLEKHKINKNNM